MTYQEAELLDAKLDRAQSQLIIDAYQLEQQADELNRKAKLYRDCANLLYDAKAALWHEYNSQPRI